MNLWLYDKLKAIWRHNTVANEKNEKIHCEDVQNDAPKFLKIRIFWRSFWLQTALKNFLRIFSSRYEYVKCCPRSYLSSALWIMVIRRTNPFLFGTVLTPPPVTLDLGHASLFVGTKFSNWKSVRKSNAFSGRWLGLWVNILLIYFSNNGIFI